MRVLDTNVLLRYLLDDDPQQSKSARRIFSDGIKHDRGLMVPDLVVAEAAWTMQAKKMDSSLVAEKLLLLVGEERILMENRERVAAALAMCKRGVKFADAYIAAAASEFGAEALISFDRGFSRMDVPWIDPSKL